MTASGVEEFTIDDLAVRTGTTVRTIRFYNEQGMLPAPERRGRIAIYDSRHRMRLDLIRELQNHGYTLAAVAKVLARMPENASATDFAVRSALLSPWSLTDTESVDRATLARRIGRTADDATVAVLERLGAIERVSDDSFTVVPAALGPALEMLTMDLPVDLFTEGAELIDTHVTALAAGVVGVALRRLLGPENSPELLRQVVDLLPRMRPLVVAALVERFNTAIDSAVHDAIVDLETSSRLPALDVENG